MRTIALVLSRVGLIVVACWASSSVASRYGQAMCRRDVSGTLVPAESHYRLCCKRCCHRYTSRPAVCIPVSQSPTVSLRRNVNCEHNDQVARWVDKWRNGNREEQEQAIEWVSRQYITAGMQRRDAELFSAPAFVARVMESCMFIFHMMDGRNTRFGCTIGWSMVPKWLGLLILQPEGNIAGARGKKGSEKAPVKTRASEFGIARERGW